LYSLLDFDPQVIAWLNELPDAAAEVAGGKGASLSRMTKAGFPVPRGFAVCTAAFRSFLESADGASLAARLTSGLDVHDGPALRKAAETMQNFIRSRSVPEEIDSAVGTAYSQLNRNTGVAVRSSARNEDGEAASFAGQQETFLNVRGANEVTRRLRECWASFFSPSAMFYRAQKGNLADTQIAVVIQEMAYPEKSGVMFTADPVEKRRDRMVVEAVFGLGEGIVSGLITPDHYLIDRNQSTLLREFISLQRIAIIQHMIYGGTTQVELSEERGASRVLSGGELNRLRILGLRLEEFFGAPQDVEWCIENGMLLLLQSRPITTL